MSTKAAWTMACSSGLHATLVASALLEPLPVLVPVVVPLPVPVVVPDGLLLPIIIPVMGEASNPSADYLRPVRWWCNSIAARVKYSIMVDVLA